MESQRGKEREQGTCYGTGVGSSEEEGAARRGSTGHVIFLAYSVRGAVDGLCAHARAREDAARAIMKRCGKSQSCAGGMLSIAGPSHQDLAVDLLSNALRGRTEGITRQAGPRSRGEAQLPEEAVREHLP